MPRQNVDSLCNDLIELLSNNLKKKLKPALFQLFQTNPSHEFTALDLASIASHIIPDCDDAPTDFVFQCEKSIVKKVNDSQKMISSLTKEIQYVKNKLNVTARKVEANKKDFSTINRKFYDSRIEVDDKLASITNEVISQSKDASLKCSAHEEVMMKIKSLENDLRSFSSQADSKFSWVDDELDAQNQYGRRNILAVKRLRYNRNENTNRIVLDLFRDMGLNISPMSLDRTHRNFGKHVQGRRRYPPDILVKFVSHDVRDYVFKNRDVLRHLPGYRHIFIDENLTAVRRDLFRDVRRSLSSK